MKQFAVVIKHPGRDWEDDVRVDIISTPDYVTSEDVRRLKERQMTGPFQVLYVTEKISEAQFKTELKPVLEKHKLHIGGVFQSNFRLDTE